MTDSVLQAEIDRSLGLRLMVGGTKESPGLAMVIQRPDGFVGYDITHLKSRVHGSPNRLKDRETLALDADTIEGFRMPPAPTLSLLQNLTPAFPEPHDSCPLRSTGYARRALHFEDGPLPGPSTIPWAGSFACRWAQGQEKALPPTGAATAPSPCTIAARPCVSARPPVPPSGWVG